MGDLSQNFSRDEFACNCGCGFDTVDTHLLYILQQMRDVFGRAVNITSGCRCQEWNRLAGGATNSQHLYGRAADVTVAGVRPQTVADWIDSYYPEASIGRYSHQGFTHIDTRTGKAARWGS